MRRIPPYIDCILHYLMETCGQIACTARTLPIRFTVGTGGTIGGFTVGTGGTIRGPLISAESANEADSALHRLHSSILSDGDLRSGRVLGLETGTIGDFTVGTGGTIRGPLISAESANEADSALHRLHSSILSDGDLRSGRVHGEDATHPFHGGHRRHNPGTIDFGGVRK